MSYSTSSSSPYQVQMKVAKSSFVTNVMATHDKLPLGKAQTPSTPSSSSPSTPSTASNYSPSSSSLTPASSNSSLSPSPSRSVKSTLPQPAKPTGVIKKRRADPEKMFHKPSRPTIRRPTGAVSPPRTPFPTEKGYKLVKPSPGTKPYRTSDARRNTRGRGKTVNVAVPKTLISPIPERNSEASVRRATALEQLIQEGLERKRLEKEGKIEVDLGPEDKELGPVNTYYRGADGELHELPPNRLKELERTRPRS
ncbi:hypothetical protein ABEF95_013463 [Exophiala dermatitidis]